MQVANLPLGHDALLFSIGLFYEYGIFYMPSGTHTAGHTKAFIYPVMDHGGGGESKGSGTRLIQTADLSVHSWTHQPPDHHDRPKSEDQLYPRSSTGL